MAKKAAAKTTKKAVAPAAPKAAAAKPATKSAAKPVAPAKVVEVKAAPKPVAALKAEPVKFVKPVKATPRVISAQERYHMIDEAAYYRAEKNAFHVDPHENWVAAEKEIDELMSKENVVVG